MTVPKLRYSVCNLENEIVLPAGALLTPELLERLARSRAKGDREEISILNYGSVYKDLVALTGSGPYRIIFDDPGKKNNVWNLMGKVHLSREILKTLDYFKQHDTYTYNHILMVFALSVLLGNDMVEHYDEMVVEAAAAPLHDFGKICVPLNVLRKTSPVTRSERAVLEHHTFAGYVLLGCSFGTHDAVAAKVALMHHERRDGSGYPRGLRLADRMVEIVAVCDIYDALISPRPYRPVSFDNRAALEEMTELANRGTIDPDIVRCLVGYNRKDKPYYEECVVSTVKRGKPPDGNLYGIILDD